MSALGSKADLIEGVEALHAEAAGALTLHIVEQLDVLDLFAQAMLGNAEATGILRALEQSQNGITAAPKRRPMLCATCPAPLRNSRYTFVIAMPATDGPHHGLGMAVCKRCGPDRETTRQKGIEALTGIWPELREVTITHPEGGRV